MHWTVASQPKSDYVCDNADVEPKVIILLPALRLGKPWAALSCINMLVKAFKLSGKGLDPFGVLFTTQGFFEKPLCFWSSQTSQHHQQLWNEDLSSKISFFKNTFKKKISFFKKYFPLKSLQDCCTLCSHWSPKGRSWKKREPREPWSCQFLVKGSRGCAIHPRQGSWSSLGSGHGLGAVGKEPKPGQCLEGPGGPWGQHGHSTSPGMSPACCNLPGDNPNLNHPYCKKPQVSPTSHTPLPREICCDSRSWPCPCHVPLPSPQVSKTMDSHR